MVSRGAKVAAGVAAVGGAIGLAWWLWPRGSGSCPAPDVPENGDGTCPDGYLADPYNPGCCMPELEFVSATPFSFTENDTVLPVTIPEGALVVVMFFGTGEPGTSRIGFAGSVEGQSLEQVSWQDPESPEVAELMQLANAPAATSITLGFTGTLYGAAYGAVVVYQSGGAITNSSFNYAYYTNASDITTGITTKADNSWVGAIAFFDLGSSVLSGNPNALTERGSSVYIIVADTDEPLVAGTKETVALSTSAPGDEIMYLFAFEIPFAG